MGGAGAGGSVALRIHKKSNRLFAFKNISLQKMTGYGIKLHEVIREHEIARRYHTPDAHFLAKQYAMWHRPDVKRCWSLHEYCENGDLGNLLGHTSDKYEKLPTSVARYFFGCALKGIEYLQKYQIVHNDLK